MLPEPHPSGFASVSTPRATIRRLPRARTIAILLHRWVGLVMAAFLVVAGTTGTVIAFYHDLDPVLNPELYEVSPPSPSAPLLDAIELRERVQHAFPEEPVAGAILEIDPGRTVSFWIDDRETFVSPYTGEVVGSREFGAISEGKQNLLTFIYLLHYSLALGDVGVFVFGLVALLWTLDCFVGATLTFPPARRRSQAPSKKSWLRRWGPAWGVKTTQLFSLVFTWHRASGLWVWGMLLVFAWSGVALNLHDVYEPVMNTVLPRAHPEPEHAHLDPPRTNPRLDFAAARRRGRELMAAEATRRGFEIHEEKWLFYEADHGTYSYTVASSLDIGERLADTWIRFDGDDGHRIEFGAPTGLDVRNSVDNWLIALHFGSWNVGGYVYCAFVSLCGLLVTALSVTGVIIWWRKRNKRRASAAV